MPKILDKIIKVKARIMEVNLLEKNLNLLMDHYQKAKDQDHQRANFPDKMEKVKVKIKMENQIQNLMEKMENQIVKIKMENQNHTGKMAKMENQIQNQMAKTENHQNQIIKVIKIQNSIITMAINPQQDILQLKTV
jgi:hypothetical protein